MGFATTLHAGTTVGGGPFPPDYAGGAVGFIAAASNPSNVSAGTSTDTNYYGATIVAIAIDAATPNNLNFIVVVEGSYDQNFLGTVSFTSDSGNLSFESQNAAWQQFNVNGQELTQWSWANAVHTFTSGSNYTIDIGNTGDVPITLTAVVPSSTEIELTWVDSLQTGVTFELWRVVNSATLAPYQNVTNAGGSFNDTALAASTQYQYQVVGTNADGSTYASNIVTVFTPASGISNTFNCDCEGIPPISGSQTLGALRVRLAARLGYAAQASNLPAGTKILFNEWLFSAQQQLYMTYKEKRIERFYAWQMVLNQRYYGIDQDESQCSSIDSLQINWVGFEDLNLAWYPLIEGIDPVMYTRAQISTGWPTHYEIRSCIEIFPAPKQQYTLWAKGPFILNAFAADTDYTTLPSELVLMLAIGLGKTHYGQPDANACMTQANNMVMKTVARSHRTARYVPRTRQNTLLTPPLFLPTIESGSQ